MPGGRGREGESTQRDAALVVSALKKAGFLVCQGHQGREAPHVCMRFFLCRTVMWRVGVS